MPSKVANRGYRPRRKDTRTYDLLKTHAPKLGGFQGIIQTLPDSFTVDSGIWMPNQNFENLLFTPPCPALPEGCTEYLGTDMVMDQRKILLNPYDLEQVLHANARGGVDLLSAMKATKDYYDEDAYWAVAAAGQIDWFDAVRIALWINQDQKRSVGVGTPWYPEWEQPDVFGRLSFPKNYAWTGGHAWKIPGWQILGNTMCLMAKTWQGNTYGNEGWVGISRVLFNAVMQVKLYRSIGPFSWVAGECEAFTLAPKSDVPIQPVDSTVVQRLINFLLTEVFHYE